MRLLLFFAMSKKLGNFVTIFLTSLIHMVFFHKHKNNSFSVKGITMNTHIQKQFLRHLQILMTIETPVSVATDIPHYVGLQK